MKDKSFIFFIIGLLFISIVTAQATQSLGVYKQNLPVNLIQSCLNSSYSNITRVVYPNSSFAINAQTIMTKTGDNYNYSLGLTSGLGQYIVYGNCNENNISTNWAYDFKITPTGDELTIGLALMYLFVFLLSLALFILFLFLYRTIGTEHSRNDEGYIVKVNWNQFAKMILFVMCYITIIWLTYNAYNIILGYTPFQSTAQYFWYVHRIFFVALRPFLVIYIIFAVVKFIKSYNLYEEVRKGFKVT